MAKKKSASVAKTSAAREKKSINLALQGGGSHGAFTWGVIDRLLDEKQLTVEAISATSAGAINAALFTYGMAQGDREEARQLLEEFWMRISQAASLTPIQPTMLEKMFGTDLSMSPSFMMLDYLTRVFSPTQLNIFDINPLRDALEDMVDFSVIRKSAKNKLFVNATNVMTGKIKVFRTEEMMLDMLLASACLPFLFRTVEVEGTPYWDGGYSGNPALFPLIYDCACKDVMVVQINPVNIQEAPVTAADILDRVNEISFNATLMREVRAIDFVSRLIDSGNVSENEYKNMKIHVIEAEDIMAGLGHASKFNADREFLLHLRDIGRQAADDWLTAHYDAIGKRSSIDVREYFL